MLFSSQTHFAPNVKNPAPAFVSLKLVMQLEGCSKSTAFRRIQFARQELAKKEHQALTLIEYIDFYDFTPQTVTMLLGCDPITLPKA